MKLNTAKKLTAGALALSMMFAMAVPMAFAESMPEVDPSAPHITKKYTATNANTTSPEETFTFTAVATNVKNAGVKEDGRTPITKADAPKLTIESAKYGLNGATTDGATKNLEITKDKPFPNVGIYYYTVTEAASGTAGVTTHAGVQLVNFFSVACELHRDWRNDMEGLAALLGKYIPAYQNIMTSFSAK